MHNSAVYGVSAGVNQERQVLWPDVVATTGRRVAEQAKERCVSFAGPC